MIKSCKKWSIMIIVVLWVFLWLFILLWLVQIFNIEKTQEYTKEYIKNTDNYIEEQFIFFKNFLVFTNTNWDWYKTDWWWNTDINYDDDDFNSQNRWWEDDDLNAFKYRYWTLDSLEYKNILAIDSKYKSISNLNLMNLSKIKIFITNKTRLDLIVLDWDYFDNNNQYKLKNKKSIDIIKDNEINIIDDASLNIKYNDILLIFLENYWNEISNYLISWIDKNWKNIDYFISWINNDKNIDYYANIYTIKDWLFFKHDKYFSNILEKWKKPTAPTFLRSEWITNSWTILNLAWDINDLVNTWSFYLFRENNNIIDCNEDSYFRKIDFPNEKIELSYNWWWNYFIMCWTTQVLEWTWIIFSIKSNLLYVE